MPYQHNLLLVQFEFCRKSVDGDNASTINRLSAELKLHKQQIVLIKHHKVGNWTCKHCMDITCTFYNNKLL